MPTGKITWRSAGIEVATFPVTGGVESQANTIRGIYGLLNGKIKVTDGLEYGDIHADFGPDYEVVIPACMHSGRASTTFVTRVQIDSTQYKKSSTPGFALVGNGYVFDGFCLIGTCWNKEEDGGLIGWPGNEPGSVRFEKCVLDASKTCAWGVYSWSTDSDRKITLNGCTFYVSRIGIAAAGSGNGRQDIMAQDCRFLCDANGSHDYGHTSGIDPVTGGVLTPVVNRLGYTLMKNCQCECIGLREEYDLRPQPKWGVPRIAGLGTNQYYTDAGPTSWKFDGCTSKITPGTATVCNDIDVRGPVSNVSSNHNREAVIAAERAGMKAIREANANARTAEAAARAAEANIAVATAQAQAGYIAAKGGTGPNGDYSTYTPPA